MRDERPDPSKPRWCEVLRWPDEVPDTRVVVIDIETTGLDIDQHQITQISAVNLGTSEAHTWRLDATLNPGTPTSDRRVEPVPAREALAQLDALLREAQAVAGHNVTAFDLPFLSRVAEALGLPWRPPALVIDLLPLSALVRPDLPSHGLAKLCRKVGVDPGTSHQAGHDAIATAACLIQARDRVHPDEPAWSVVLACLAGGSHPLTSFLPCPVHPLSEEVIKQALVPVPDDLCEDASSTSIADCALDAAAFGLPELRRTVGFRQRLGQDEMAQTVGQVLDAGGRLAVEAPTGVGKSLAYLVPAAGRAVRRDRPVLIATATKVLQQQLRGDAARLRDVGLLTAPFRQLVGVSSYICTRNLLDAIKAGERSPEGALALATGVRCLTATTSGRGRNSTTGPCVGTTTTRCARR